MIQSIRWLSWVVYALGIAALMFLFHIALHPDFFCYSGNCEGGRLNYEGRVMEAFGSEFIIFVLVPAFVAAFILNAIEYKYNEKKNQFRKYEVIGFGASTVFAVVWVGPFILM